MKIYKKRRVYDNFYDVIEISFSEFSGQLDNTEMYEYEIIETNLEINQDFLDFINDEILN